MFRSSTLWFLIGIAAATWIIWPNSGAAVSAGKAAPEITGGHWLNSKPLTIAGLRGRVVLLEFWTYG
ncbi:MAG: hypothetical protein ACREQ2_10610 [Candidatus Binatia bacterium]